MAALSQVAAIAGLGGIGKTQTAVEYAYRHFPADYDWVFWVKADTELNGVTDLANIGRSLNLSGTTLDELALQMRLWLETNERWLLIFDNVDQPELLKAVMPRGHRGKVLLTSRARRFVSLGIKAPIEVQKLSLDDSIKFLKDRTQQSHLDAAELTAATELARELDGLPLALEQAAAYIDEMQVTFAVYIAHYRRQPVDVLERRLPETGDYPASVATTWQLNFEEVRQRSPLAGQILQVSSVWAADDIVEALLKRPELGLLGAEDELTLAEGLAALGSFSLIDRKREIASYSVHRMVQEVVWYGLNTSQQEDWMNRVIALFDTIFPDPTNIESWKSCGDLVPHVQGICLRLETSPVETLDLARLFNQTGHYLSVQGRYNEAESLFVQSLKIREHQLGTDHLSVATSLNNLGLLYKLQGHYSEAEPLLVRSLEIRERHLGTDHLSVATSLNNLGELYRTQGHYGEAKPLLVRSLEIRERQLEANHPSVATSLNNLAGLYESQGRYSEAEPLFVRSLKILKYRLGADHPNVATSLNNLARIYYFQGRYSEAESMFLQSLEIREKNLELDHPDVANSFDHLAVLYHTQGRYSEAEPLYVRSLEIRKRWLGADHPDVATSLNNLARLYDSQSRYSEAEPLYAQSLKIAETALGIAHATTMTIRQNYADCLKSMANVPRSSLHENFTILHGEIAENLQTEDMMKFAESGFQERNDEEEDIYDSESS